MPAGNRCVFKGLLTVALVVGPAAARLTGTQQRKCAEKLSARELVKLAEEVEQEVAALRGWKFKRAVRKDVRTEKQLRAFIEKRVFEEDYGAGKLECLQALLPMVGLIPADCDLKQTFMDVLFNQIGGFYDPDGGAFYMLQRGGVNYGPLVNRILIAHELTHALDDQYVDLDKLLRSPEQTEDRMFAVAAIVEGSATVLMTRYATRALHSGEYDLAELVEVAQSEMERSKVFLEAPRYFTTLMANYLCGMTFLLRGNLMALAGDAESKGVGEDFLAAAKDPPRSSEQILHPEKYWDPKERDEPITVKDEDVERLLRQPGVHVVHKNTVGELLCALLAFPEDRQFDPNLAIMPGYWTNDAATGWGGDRFFLLAAGKNRSAAKKRLKDVKGAWITMWDSREDRDEFVEDYEAERDLPARCHFNLDRRVAVFLFGFDAQTAGDLQARFSESPPSFRCGKEAWSPGDR